MLHPIPAPAYVKKAFAPWTPAKSAFTINPMTNPAPAETPAGENGITAKPRKKLRTRALETGVGIAGFDGVLRAWRAEGNRLKNVAASLGKKMADMAAGAMISMSFRLIAVTWVVGIIGGVSTWGMIGLLAAATGAASATYNYAKNFAGEKLRGPKEQRHAAKLFDSKRLKKSALAFAAGFASGGIGLWLARSEIVQSSLSWLRGIFTRADTVPLPAAAIAALPPIQTAAPMPGTLTPAFTPAAANMNTPPAAALPAVRGVKPPRL